MAISIYRRKSFFASPGAAQATVNVPGTGMASGLGAASQNLMSNAVQLSSVESKGVLSEYDEVLGGVQNTLDAANRRSSIASSRTKEFFNMGANLLQAAQHTDAAEYREASAKKKKLELALAKQEAVDKGIQKLQDGVEVEKAVSESSMRSNEALGSIVASAKGNTEGLAKRLADAYDAETEASSDRLKTDGVDGTRSLNYERARFSGRAAVLKGNIARGKKDQTAAIKNTFESNRKIIQDEMVHSKDLNSALARLGGLHAKYGVDIYGPNGNIEKFSEDRSALVQTHINNLTNQGKASEGTAWENEVYGLLYQNEKIDKALGPERLAELRKGYAGTIATRRSEYIRQLGFDSTTAVHTLIEVSTDGSNKNYTTEIAETRKKLGHQVTNLKTMYESGFLVGEDERTSMPLRASNLSEINTAIGKVTTQLKALDKMTEDFSKAEIDRIKSDPIAIKEFSTARLDLIQGLDSAESLEDTFNLLNDFISVSATSFTSDKMSTKDFGTQVLGLEKLVRNGYAVEDKKTVGGKKVNKKNGKKIVTALNKISSGVAKAAREMSNGSESRYNFLLANGLSEMLGNFDDDEGGFFSIKLSKWGANPKNSTRTNIEISTEKFLRGFRNRHGGKTYTTNYGTPIDSGIERVTDEDGNTFYRDRG